MSISKKFSAGSRFITNKALWIIFIPIVLDLTALFSWEKLFHTVYNPVQKGFMIKIGFISAPPSVKFLLEDFPTALFKYDDSGLTGILNTFSLFNAALFMTIMLVTSFLSSCYMSIIGTRSTEWVKIGDFFIEGNKKWHKFFLLDCITLLPMVLMIFNRSYIYFSFVTIIFVYVQYSFVTDEVSILQNFRLGITFLFSNLGLTIKMAVYFGFIFSMASLVVFPLSRLGSIGIIIDIVICAYLGACVNRTIIDIYRDQCGAGMRAS